VFLFLFFSCDDGGESALWTNTPLFGVNSVGLLPDVLFVLTFQEKSNGVEINTSLCKPAGTLSIKLILPVFPARLSRPPRYQVLGLQG